MGIEAVLLFIGIAVAVAAIAIYLIIVTVLLNQVSFNVGTVLVGVRAISNQTAPIGAVLKDMVRDVQDIESALDSLVMQAEEAEELAAPARGSVGRGSGRG